MTVDISEPLRTAVTDLLAWYDRMLADQPATLAELARCVEQLKEARPFPEGQIGIDLDHVVKPTHGTTRIDHVEALERLRHLTRNRPEQPATLPFE